MAGREAHSLVERLLPVPDDPVGDGLCGVTEPHCCVRVLRVVRLAEGIHPVLLQEPGRLLELTLGPGLIDGVGAASGALLGAAVTQSTTIPDEDARSLNIASLNAVIGINWPALLEGELRKEALAYGKQSVPAGHGVPVSVQIVDLQWNTSVGDRLAIHAVIEVSMWGSDGQRLTDSIKLRGKRMHVAKWTADDGAPIRAAMQQMIAEASEAVWQSIAG